MSNDTHVVLAGSERPSSGERVGDADPNAKVEVTLDLRAPALPGGDRPRGKTLTHEQFAQDYGSSQQDADLVQKVLEGYGLKVDEISLPTNSMQVSGPVSAMEAAFQSKLGMYRSPTQVLYRGRAGEIRIPIELNGIIEGVLGLDERQVAYRASRTARNIAAPRKAGSPRKSAQPRQAAVGAVALSPLGPANLETRYNFPPGNGAGETIAIAEFGGGYFAGDVSAYCAKFGRPVPNIIIQPVNLAPLTLAKIRQLPPKEQKDQLDTSTEVMMDVQVIAGLCPAATIVVYFATFDQKGWVDLLNQIIGGQPARCVTLSISYGMAEDDADWSANARDAINQRLNAASLLGITVCISSGDDGSGDEENDRKAHVDFPSASPYVLSVGGTMINGTSASNTEVTWRVSPGRRNQKGGGATGGGVSIFYQRPQWQNVHIASLNPGSIDGRVMPDVAALAGDPLYELIFLGKSQPNGGTSASAPLWAALIARINAVLPPAKKQRFLAPLLYENGPNGHPRGQTGCQDITVGDNTSDPFPGVGYHAGPGFDAVTGWGTPDGVALAGIL